MPHKNPPPVTIDETDLRFIAEQTAGRDYVQPLIKVVFGESALGKPVPWVGLLRDTGTRLLWGNEERTVAYVYATGGFEHYYPHVILGRIKEALAQVAYARQQRRLAQRMKTLARYHANDLRKWHLSADYLHFLNPEAEALRLESDNAEAARQCHFEHKTCYLMEWQLFAQLRKLFLLIRA